MSRYHVYLNGKGYILADQGRVMRPLPPFTPRFSTGDPGVGDFTYWQFWQMKDFRGGSGQEYYGDETKYYSSLGIDPSKEKELTLLPRMTQIAQLPPDEWKLLEYNGQLYAFGKSTGNVANWSETAIQKADRRQSAGLWGLGAAILGGLLFGPLGFLGGAALGVGIGAIVAQDQVTGGQVKAHTISAYAVTGDLLIIGTEDGRLVSCLGTAEKRATGLKAWNTDINSPITAITAFEDGIIYAQRGKLCYIPVNLDGSFDKDKKLEIGALAGVWVRYFALWNQKVYFGGVDMGGRSVIGWTDGRRVQGTYTIPGRFQLWGMKSFFGYLIYVGGRPTDEEPVLLSVSKIEEYLGDLGTIDINMKNSIFNTSLGNLAANVYEKMKQQIQTGRPDIKINDSFTIQSGYKGEVYIYPNELLFELKNDWGYDNTIYDITAANDLLIPWSHGMGIYHIMPNKGYWPGSLVPVEPNPLNVITGIEEFAGNEIFVTADGRVYQTLRNRFVDGGVIELSCFQAGVDLMEKIWRDIFVYTKFPLDPGMEIEILAKPVCSQPWEVVGKMTKGQSKGYGIIGFTSPSLYLKLRLKTSNERMAPIVEQIVTRYVPGAPKKRAWGLQIKTENALKLLDGTYEKRMGQEIANDIWVAYLANTPVQFIDIDGREYGVLVTDIEETTPAINMGRLEHVIKVELLEA